MTYNQMQTEIDRLRKENAGERKRAEFWKAETEKRAECLKRLEAVPLDCDGSVFCPDCDQPEGHLNECELFWLMTMPEEPKL